MAYLTESSINAKYTYSDLIATGGSASAAGELIEKCGGKTLEYLFIVGLPFLKVCRGTSEVFGLRSLLYFSQGHEKLNAPAYSMIEAED